MPGLRQSAVGGRRFSPLWRRTDSLMAGWLWAESSFFASPLQEPAQQKLVQLGTSNPGSTNTANTTTTCGKGVLLVTHTTLWRAAHTLLVTRLIVGGYSTSAHTASLIMELHTLMQWSTAATSLAPRITSSSFRPGQPWPPCSMQRHAKPPDIHITASQHSDNYLMSKFTLLGHVPRYSNNFNSTLGQYNYFFSTFTQCSRCSSRAHCP